MTDTNVSCDFTPNNNNQLMSKKHSIHDDSELSSRRSSKASDLEMDSSVEDEKKLKNIPNSILIDPQDMKKLELMAELESDEEELNGDDFTLNMANDSNFIDQNRYYSSEELKDEDILKEIDENKIIELKEAFELFDINGDGLITHTDLKKTFISLGLEVPDDEITRMLDDGSKPLDETAFIKMVGAKTIHLDPDDIMYEALSKWDRNNSGLIPLEKISQDLMASGDRFTEEEVEVALEEAPVITVKGIKMIDYKEFSKMLCCIRKTRLSVN